MIHEDLEAAGLVMRVPFDPGVPALSSAEDVPRVQVVDGCAYLDDCLDFGCVDDPWQCIDKAAQALAIVYDAFTAHGLKVNLEPGKTEVSFYFVGEGARAARSSLAGGTLAFTSKYRGRAATAVTR